MIRLLGRAGIAACVATVLFEATLLTRWTLDGSLHRWSLREIVAILYDVDRESLAIFREEIDTPERFEAIELDEYERERTRFVLDLDMRERAMDAALADLRYYQRRLSAEQSRYESVRVSFEEAVTDAFGTATDPALLKVRDWLSNLEPVHAKDQIMTMLQRGDDSGDAEILNDVVVMLKTMPIDKRRKILSEFRTDPERARVDRIFRELRNGTPEVPLIRRTRDRLRQFDPVDEEDST